MVNGLTALFRDGTLVGMSDRQILERFVKRHDDAAFEAIVSRHGPMVRNVCRQFLFNPHDVDDAFQAVFLVLVRKARFLSADESLGPWLYRVAERVAARARANRLKLSARETSRAQFPEPAYPAPGLDFEIPCVVHDELGRLPERLRAPLVLCYLEGLTHDSAARQLCCPVGTVRSRLARGRSLLHRRMTRRGFALSTAALGGMLESGAIAAVASQTPARSIGAAAQAMSESVGCAGMGCYGAFATFLEGVWNVANFKGIAILGAVVSVGALAIGLSQTTGVGRTPAPTSRMSASPYGNTPIQKEPTKDPIEPYLLTKEAGPFMVMARAFRGPDAERLAIALAEELRTDYGLAAYIFRRKEFLGGNMIRGKAPQSPGEVLAPDTKSPEKIRKIDETAVLIGNEKDAPSQEKLWREIKKIQPKCLEQIPSAFPWRRGLATAFRTTNPYGRAEILIPRAEQNPIKPMMQMNMGLRSIINCPGQYTLQIAEFEGRATYDFNRKVTPTHTLTALKEGPLSADQDDAERLAERLSKAPEIRALAQPIYVFHDRSSSKVFIGAFNSPQEPQAVAIRDRLIRAVEMMSNNTENGRNSIDIMINPAHDLTDLSDTKAAIRN